MANITGTNGIDTLTGTPENDTIQGLGGNDIINVSDGNDTIDGGAGADIADYNGISGGNDLSLQSDRLIVSHQQITNIPFFSFNDELVNIETIIGNQSADLFNSISVERGVSADIDLSNNRVNYSSTFFGTKTVIAKNFKDVSVKEGGKISRVKGNDFDNIISVGDSKTTIIGSKGNDNIFGNNSSIDYSNIGRALSFDVTISGSDRPNNIDFNTFINKNDFGIDRIGPGSKIIGTNNQENTINAFTAPVPPNQPGFRFGAKLDVDLKNNSLTISVPDSIIGNPQRIQKYEIVNFINVIGGNFDDKIIGADKNSKLTGGGGNDTITGGNRNDQITGSNSTAKGVGEVDVLTGGGGRDKFVLGDASGAYYVGKGKDDYATITDFNLFQDSISIGNLKDYSFGFSRNNSIELYSGKDVNTRDLIAKIQLANGAQALKRISKSALGASPMMAKASGFGLDSSSISAQINILSGANSIAETLI